MTTFSPAPASARPRRAATAVRSVAASSRARRAVRSNDAANKFGAVLLMGIGMVIFGFLAYSGAILMGQGMLSKSIIAREASESRIETAEREIESLRRQLQARGATVEIEQMAGRMGLYPNGEIVLKEANEAE